MATVALDANSLSQAVRDLSIKFFDKNNKHEYEDYIGYEQLVDEFLRLRLPHASDILNVAAGPGILSAKVQGYGYSNLDAHENDPTRIRRLMKTGLYRNYICRPITGLYTTGIKDDTYDVILMAGGFTPDNISPTSINELLRITKADGHILFTLREDYHQGSSEFALLEGNLAALEQDKKCQVKKRGEKFEDSHSGLRGALYVIQRTDLEDFSAPVPKAMTSMVMDSLKNPAEEEEDMVVVGHYTGHIKLCEAFLKLRLPKTVEILDVSAHGTNPGLVGKELIHNGYEVIDGIDTDLKKLNKVRSQKIYRNHILGRLAELGSIPVKDESYDVILMAGGFAPGKILPSAFNELLRILRPGGYIMWTMRDGYGATDPDFALFDVRVEDLVKQRQWDLLVGPVMFDKYEMDHAGRFYMLQKCHRAVFALGSPRHSPRASPKSSPVTRRRFLDVTTKK